MASTNESPIIRLRVPRDFIAFVDAAAAAYSLTRSGYVRRAIVRSLEADFDYRRQHRAAPIKAGAE